MSRNHNRSNHYSAGSSALTLPGRSGRWPNGRPGSTGVQRSTGGAPYMAAFEPGVNRPALKPSAPAGNIPLPGNVVESFPGPTSSRATGSYSVRPCPVGSRSVGHDSVGGSAPGAVDAPSRSRGSIWLMGSEAGMATAEYAIATLAAVGFAGLLVFILRSDEVRGFLLNLIRTALALP